MEELAEEAGITVRTLRFYRERKLIPPPRREGRIAWYDDHHLARLRTIPALLERGHTLSGIAELAEAFESGRDVGELLGLGATPPRRPRSASPPRNSPTTSSGEATPENLAAALDLGYLATDGDEIVHISRRLLDVSSALVREGVPLADGPGRRPPRPRARRRPGRALHRPRPRQRPHPRGPSTACARWRRAWWRRNCRWRWTACAPGTGRAEAAGRPRRQARSSESKTTRHRRMVATSAPHAWRPAPRTP